MGKKSKNKQTKNKKSLIKRSITMAEIYPESVSAVLPGEIDVEEVEMTITDVPTFEETIQTPIDEYEKTEIENDIKADQEIKKPCDTCAGKAIQKALKTQYIFCGTSAIALMFVLYMSKKEGINKFILGFSGGLFSAVFISSIREIIYLNNQKNKLIQQMA